MFWWMASLQISFIMICVPIFSPEKCVASWLKKEQEFILFVNETSSYASKVPFNFIQTLILHLEKNGALIRPSTFTAAYLSSYRLIISIVNCLNYSTHILIWSGNTKLSRRLIVSLTRKKIQINLILSGKFPLKQQMANTCFLCKKVTYMEVVLDWPKP